MTPEQTNKFNRWQWRTIIGTMIGYAIFYVVRKNFSFAIPGLTAQYGITKTAFGIIMTLIGVIYGASRFVNGIIADRSNGRWHMAIGLTGSAIVNILFGFGAIIVTSMTGLSQGPAFVRGLVVFFAVLLILNNVFQGCGFPPCNRLITHWVAPSELATKMSLWNTSHSIGAFIVSVLCGWLMGHAGTDVSADPEMRARVIENTKDAVAGLPPEKAEAFLNNALQHVGAWQWAFWVPAIIAVFGVIFIILTLRDTPKSVGLPELEGTKTKLDDNDSPAAFKKFLREKVWFNPIIWIIAISDFFVYVVRFAVLDWGPTFLQESRGLSPAMAGWTVAIFECFGVCGMLLAGWISDKVFKGRAQRTCLFCMLGVILFVTAFFLLPEKTSPIILLIILACAGFFIYGPQALCGIIASQQATNRAASTANGLIGMICYLSVLVSGWGFGVVSDNFGWKWVFVTMIIVSVLGFLGFALLWNTARDGYDK